MGCWNKTCGLTGLHIISGTPVYVFVLEKDGGHERCYSTAFWRPLLVPFVSEYNDYGGGEDSSGIALPYILEGLKDNLVEMELGENEYHDIPVKADAFNEELFFEAVHEGRLNIKNYMGETQVDFTMFRKDVMDDVLATWRRQDYVGEGKGTTGWDNCYTEYGFADILADIPAFMERLVADVADKDKFRFERGLDRLFKYDEANLVGKWVRIESYRFSSIVRVAEMMEELVKAGNIDAATEFLTEHLKAQYINGFMEMTRKNWAPGGYEGSQSQEHHGYRVLANTINKVLDTARKESEAENDEEFSDF